jgi:2-phosphoglycolate phosphatase
VPAPGVTRRADVVLFDLDGTLVDSAPDLAGAANDLRIAEGLEPMAFEQLRPMVGAGARGMVGLAFDARPGDGRYEALRQAFLHRYAQRLLHSTRVFADVDPVIDALDMCGLPWGIVTNKALALAQPIVDGLGLSRRAAVLIGGDSTPFSKPHPEPLLEAARRIGADPARCVYVGDDARDIVAGRAAGMATLAAAWGYLGEGAPVHEWGAGGVLEQPGALLHWLSMP